MMQITDASTLQGFGSTKLIRISKFKLYLKQDYLELNRDSIPDQKQSKWGRFKYHPFFYAVYMRWYFKFLGLS